MSVLDGGRSEGSHKRVLGPLAEIHETQRLQVKHLKSHLKAAHHL